jgi:hypothetical protein
MLGDAYPKEATDYKLGFYVHLIKGDYENEDGKTVALLVPSRKLAREGANTCFLITKYRENIGKKEIDKARNLIKAHRFDPYNMSILIDSESNYRNILKKRGENNGCEI